MEESTALQRYRLNSKKRTNSLTGPCGRRGLALKRFDIRGNRNGLNVFEVLVPGALSPGQELLDCPAAGGSRVSVADRIRGETLSDAIPSYALSRPKDWVSSKVVVDYACLLVAEIVAGLARACCEMSRRDSAIVAWHEVPGTAPPQRAVP